MPQVSRRKEKIMFRKTLTLLFLMFAGLSRLFAQSSSDVMGTPWITDKSVLYFMYIVIGILLIFVLLLYKIASHLSQYVQQKEAVDKEEAKPYRFWERFFQVKSVSTDKDMMLDHDYDGIRELDNPAPPWFMYLFYGTILFAVIYFVRFEITKTGPSQQEEYTAELEAAESQRIAREGTPGGATETLNITEDNVEVTTNAEDLNLGKITFVSKCQVCHGEGGKGLSGPNLTDEYWIHGGGVKDLYKTIKYGVPDKGMAPWESSLSPKQIRDVASYILGLDPITEAEGGLPPKGELYKPVEVTTNADTSAVDTAGNTQ